MAYGRPLLPRVIRRKTGHAPRRRKPTWTSIQTARAPGTIRGAVSAGPDPVGLDWSRRDAVPVFLETATPTNVPLYEHFGLRAYAAEVAPEGGPQVWFLRFDP